jgi:hypothetical protein
MPARPSLPGIRARALLAAFLVYAFGILPFLAASHVHADEASHATCQLCQASAPACEPPAPALALSPAPVSILPPCDDSPRALSALPSAYESRGPPSA